ncbi:MAG: PadR family transcriptional regulator [Symploca sp. SIO3C6]|nr:PadR family transcriptional regulator [Symploca sp. SIO3C6]
MAKKHEDGGIVLSALEEDLLTAIRGHQDGIYGLDLLGQINTANEKLKRRQIGVGSLYPALKRMETQGLVKARWGEDDDSGGARRRYYNITGLGSSALEDTWLYRQQLGAPWNLAFKGISRLAGW